MNNKNKEKLFIYGTLADPKIQKQVWGRITKTTPDILQGYKISEIEIEGEIYPLIIPSKFSEVNGWIIEITNKELEKIDEYESNSYKREKVTLKSGTIAWVYLKR